MDSESTCKICGGAHPTGACQETNVEYVGKKVPAGEGVVVSSHERIILGKRMPGTQRSVLPDYESGLSSWDTGEIGFLDFDDKNDIITVPLLGVEPEFRGQGYAQQLLEKAEEIAIERNAKEIRVTQVTNHEAMDPLLKKLNYKRIKGTDHAYRKIIKN